MPDPALDPLPACWPLLPERLPACCPDEPWLPPGAEVRPSLEDDEEEEPEDDDCEPDEEDDDEEDCDPDFDGSLLLLRLPDDDGEGIGMGMLIGDDDGVDGDPAGGLLRHPDSATTPAINTPDLITPGCLLIASLRRPHPGLDAIAFGRRTPNLSFRS